MGTRRNYLTFANALEPTTPTRLHATRRPSRGLLALAIVLLVCLVVFAAATTNVLSRHHALLRLAQRRPVVLVTGFTPFANYSVNPSQLVALHLNRTCTPRVCFDALLVPVTTTGVRHAAAMIRKRHHAVLLLGLENSAKGLKIEVVAQNLRQTASGGAWANDMPPDAPQAIHGAPRMLATTAPLDKISLAELSLSGTLELWSNDAGSFACNELYYRALHLVRMHNIRRSDTALLPTLFVHLPTIDVAPISHVVPIIQKLSHLML